MSIFKKAKKEVSIENLIDQMGGKDVLGLRSVGPSQLRGNCPFKNHPGDRNSDSFDIDLKKQIYNCKTHCGAGQDSIDFYCDLKGYNRNSTIDVYKVANIILENFAGNNISNKRQVTENRKRQEILNNNTVNFYLTFKKTKDLLKHRNINDQTINYFGVGKPDKSKLFPNHIVFPLHNENGEKVGYSGQALEKEDNKIKWVFPPGFIKKIVLFNYHRVKRLLPVPDIIIVESPYSVLYLHQEGFKNIVSSLGLNVSETQLKLILRLSNDLILFFDNDLAGKLATINFVLDNIEKKTNINVIKYPKSKTRFKPTHFTQKEIETLLQTAVTIEKSYDVFKLYSKGELNLIQEKSKQSKIIIEIQKYLIQIE